MFWNLKFPIQRVVVVLGKKTESGQDVVVFNVSSHDATQITDSRMRSHTSGAVQPSSTQTVRSILQQKLIILKLDC